jgi:hypothetical protein
MKTRKLKRDFWKKGKLLNKEGEVVYVWPSVVLPEGLHPTKGWGAKSRTGKRSN